MDRPRLPARAGADLRACLDSIAKGRRGEAVDLARALAADPERLTRFIGARLLYLLRLYQEAFDSLEEHLRAHGDDAYALRLRYSLLKRLRFEQEGGGALGALLRVADDARVHEAAVLHFQGMGRPQIALAHLGRVLRAKDGAAHQYRAQLRLAVDAGDLDTARRAATRALQLDPARWLDVVDKLLEAGFFDLAEREADRHVETPEGRAVLGQLALFGGAWSRAYEHASSACERDPGCERAIAVMVGASVMGGDLDRAERDLARRRGDLGPTLRTWLAEILLRRNDLAGARRELTRVQNEVPDYFPAKLLWVLVKGELDREEWATLSAYDGLLEGQIQALGIELPVADGRIAASPLAAAAAEALALLKGNRSPFPSVVRGGELQSVRVPRGARHRVREVQHATPWIGIDRAKAEVVAELARIGPHPIAECYEAELYLWAGDYAAARGKFERILAGAPRTTWAWIGLGANLVLLGDAGRGLSTLDEGVKVMGFRGATLPVYRGEALFRLGRLDEAAAELEEACQTHPSRVAAWVLRVLVEHARGRAAGRDQAFAHLDGAATALLSDAARAARVDGWWPGSPSAETQQRVAAQALVLMRGNRSSSCAFWFAPGTDVIRSIVYQRPVTTPDWEAGEKRALLALA